MDILKSSFKKKKPRFANLQAAGISRIVSRHTTPLENCVRAARELDISWGIVKDSPPGVCVFFLIAYYSFNSVLVS